MEKHKFSTSEFLSFLDYVIDKGLLNRATATSRKSAALKVLEILDEDEKTDLRKIDKEQVFSRFVNINGKAYKPDSQQVYRSRFNAALDDFLRYAENPAGFKTSTISKGGKDKQTDNKKGNKSKPEFVSSKPPILLLPPPPGFLEIPVPLDDGRVVKIQLPPSLTEAEANKISAIVKAYALSSS
ncbi:MAG: hypothetical protein RL020_878 [Pseudomonadota bacterium]|jgi:hypothetical protein